MAAYGHLPLAFEPNQGQTDSHVSFVARGPTYGLFLAGADAVLTLANVQSLPLQRHLSIADYIGARVAVTPTLPITYTALRLHYIGADPLAQVSGEEPLSGTVNYLIGKHPSAWQRNVHTYGRVSYHHLYPGIDLTYHGSQGRLEYDWTVAPTATVGTIAFSVEGTRSMTIDRDGNLALSTAAGFTAIYAPVAYQVVGGQRHDVQAAYTITGTNQVGVVVGAYNHDLPLVIDPVLGYSTYLGSSAAGYGIAVDRSGSAYVTGEAYSSSFPTTPGAYTSPYNTGSGDVFVTKFNPAGNQIVYSTYFGGYAEDVGAGIAVDRAGEAYITGRTTSVDFPTVNGLNYYTVQPCAYNPDISDQSCVNGPATYAFVSKLTAAGNNLAFSTLVGTTAQNFDDPDNNSVTIGSAIALDGAGNAYITGQTNSVEIPMLNAQQNANSGGNDAFVTAIKADGSAYLYSTYLGGSGNDAGAGIVVDSGGNAYVAGSTSSGNFPTRHAYQSALDNGTSSGKSNAFVTKLTPNGSLSYSTYFGGSGGDSGNAIAIDGGGNAYITGQTASLDFPMHNATQAASGGGADAFAARLNADGSLGYSTYIGGSGTDVGSGIAVDSGGNATIVGTTASSTTLPITGSAFQSSYGGGSSDAFVAQLTTNGGLTSSSYLGGGGTDTGNAVAVDAVGNSYVTGETTSTNFPTVSPYSSTIPSGSTSAFVTKVGVALLPGTIGTIAGPGGPYSSASPASRISLIRP